MQWCKFSVLTHRCAITQQDLAGLLLMEVRKGSGLLTKARGGQVSMWQHLVELKCLVICIPPAMAQPSYPPQVCCIGAKADGKLAAIATPPPPAFFPLSHYPKHAHVGELVSTTLTALRSMAMSTHTYFRTLGTALFPSFFPIQLRFVAVRWTVGFPRLQETDGCLVSENRTNSLPHLSLCLLLKSDQHSTLMEEEEKEAERSETGSERDKARMLREAG